MWVTTFTSKQLAEMSHNSWGFLKLAIRYLFNGYEGEVHMKTSFEDSKLTIWGPGEPPNQIVWPFTKYTEVKEDE